MDIPTPSIKVEAASSSSAKDCSAPKNYTSGTYYIGQQGLQRYYMSNTTGVNHNNWRDFIGTEQIAEASIYTAPEVAATELGHKRFYGWRGYFKAPGKGKYRFLMSCDDTCVMDLSICEPKEPQSMERLLTRNSWT